MKYHEIKEFASRLRKNQTNEEKILWKYLRKRQLKGKRFVRQHPIRFESINNNHFFFIPDFYCAQEKLIVELDGKIHNSRKAKDFTRDKILWSKGYRVVRIKNEELRDISEVLDKISKYFNKPPPPPYR